MIKSIYLLICIIFGINSLTANMIPEDIGQEKTIMISGEQLNKEVMDEVLADVKQRLEERCYWGDYEKNQEIQLKLVYTYEEYFKSVLNKKVILVLVENTRREIWPYKINGDNIVASDIIAFLGENNIADMVDDKKEDIGHKFFENGALEATIKIEGTYTIPPMKVVTELQKKEVECVKKFVIKLIKEKGWENKFPDGQVYLWMTVTKEEEKEEEDIDFVHVDFFIENGKGWGFGADLRLNKERTKCEFDVMSFSERSEYRAPDVIAEKMKTFYHKEILKIGLEI